MDEGLEEVEMYVAMKEDSYLSSTIKGRQRYFNHRVRPKSFKVGNFIMKEVKMTTQDQGNDHTRSRKA